MMTYLREVNWPLIRCWTNSEVEVFILFILEVVFLISNWRCCFGSGWWIHYMLINTIHWRVGDKIAAVTKHAVCGLTFSVNEGRLLMLSIHRIEGISTTPSQYGSMKAQIECYWIGCWSETIFHMYYQLEKLVTESYGSHILLHKCEMNLSSAGSDGGWDLVGNLLQRQGVVSKPCRGRSDVHVLRREGNQGRVLNSYL